MLLGNFGISTDFLETISKPEDSAHASPCRLKDEDARKTL